MSRIRLHVLGTLSIYQGDQPIHINRRKGQAMLVYLALTGRAQRRDTLAALLWPEANSSHALGELRRNLYALRKDLGSSVLIADADTVALQNDEAALWVDALQYRKLVSQTGIDALRTAIELYEGDLLAGFTLPDAADFEEWRYFEAESLRQAQVNALEQLMRWHAGQGHYDKAIDYARRRLAMDSLHEPAHRELMQLYAWSGLQSAALRQYKQCCSILAEELGVLPDSETIQLYEQIRIGQLPDQAPRPGSFDERNNLPVSSTPFVGRTAQLAHVAELLANPNCCLLTILGPGGIGKTRLAIRAAHEQWGRFRDGVCYVDLAPLQTPNLLATTVLRALGAPDYGAADSERRLCDVLRHKEMLLVLDNFEHLK